jgi:hypothetical protein
MAHTSYILDKQGYMNSRVCTRERFRAHARTSAHAHTHSHKYVIFIAFPQQEWLRERASLLRYTHTACLVKSTAAVRMTSRINSRDPQAITEEDHLLMQSVSGRRPIKREERWRRGFCLAVQVTSLTETPTSSWSYVSFIIYGEIWRGVDRKIILKWIFERLGVGAQTGLIWLRIGTGGGLLCIRWW